MNRVYLCEKPSQAADIARVLACNRRNDGFLSDSTGTSVTWCIGHLLEQAPPEDYDPALKTWRYETIPFVPTNWKVRIAHRRGKPHRGYAKQLRIIRSLLQKADEVVIACDAGREGEAIGREVLDYAGYHGTIRRLWLSAFVDAAIRKAIANLKDGTETYPLYCAALARARADWVVGLNLTRLYTLMARDHRVDCLLSVGRVQSPTLSMIVVRDRLIECFKPQHYYVVIADCEKIGNCQFSATWIPRDDAPYTDTEGRCTNPSTARTLAQFILHQPIGQVAQCTVTPQREYPPLPFSLSTLQQTASAQFGLKAETTLRAAQALYEKHKLTTYPRTDSTHLSEALFTDVGATLETLVRIDACLQPIVAQADPARRSRAWNDAKVTDHHAIIPTTGRARLDALSTDARRVYDLIRRRYLAQFFEPFLYERIVLDVDFDVTHPDFSRERFRATGRRVTERGWKVVVDDESDAPTDPTLSPLPTGVDVQAMSVRDEARETQPPKRFTDGTLIAAMSNVARTVDDPTLRKMLRDTSGLGTEATRANILETIIGRGFVSRESKHLISTPLGRALVDALPGPIKDPAMTALWEQSLDDIAHGRVAYDQFLERQYTWLRQLVEHVNASRAHYCAPLLNVPTTTRPAKKRQRKRRAH